MPLYEFKCGGCGQTLEQLARSSSDKWSECPECGGKLRQLFSPFAIFMGAAPLSFHHKFAYPHTDSKKP